ncbi:IS3 family transposase [Parapedobacter composti]
MKAIDRKFLDCPFYGVERMTAYLKMDLGYSVGEKRIRRLRSHIGPALMLGVPSISTTTTVVLVTPVFWSLQNFVSTKNN